LWKTGSPPSVFATGDIPSGASGTSYCFGDGSVAPCPCANNGFLGHGCNNSAATGGAVITASGVASLSLDTLHFTSTNELPSALSIVLQGSLQVAPTNFGDGLRCAGGSLFRLYSTNASGGTLTVPGFSDPSVSARSAALGDAIPVGATRHYQVYYRDPSTSFCPNPPGDNFNATNAVSIMWGS
jgi:hypothetical protein